MELVPAMRLVITGSAAFPPPLCIQSQIERRSPAVYRREVGSPAGVMTWHLPLHRGLLWVLSMTG
jgi:hypothetical protein